MIISTNDGVCRKKQQYSPIIEEFDDGAILLIESSYPTMYIEDVAMVNCNGKLILDTEGSIFRHL